MTVGYGDERSPTRYVFRSAISNSRIDSVDDSGVTFHYKDYADGGKTKSMHMGGTEFIGSFLMHVLPKGFCRVRFSGCLSNCQKTKKLKLIHKLRNTIYTGNPVKGKTLRNSCSCFITRTSASSCNGYQIRYSYKSSMASSKTAQVSKATTTSKRISKLTPKKYVYVQVRAYKNNSGEKVYGTWSKKVKSRGKIK